MSFSDMMLRRPPDGDPKTALGTWRFRMMEIYLFGPEHNLSNEKKS